MPTYTLNFHKERKKSSHNGVTYSALTEAPAEGAEAVEDVN